MTSLLLNTQDETKTDKFLKTVNYIGIHELTEAKLIVSLQEKNIMRHR